MKKHKSKIHQPHERKFCKSLTFAPGGHGKTTFLGTAQEDERTYPMLFLDWESGTESLAGLDIDVWSIRSWRDADEAIELLESDSDDNDYRSVGIDSTSEWHLWALHNILDRKGAQRKEPDLIEMGDYGIAGTQLRRKLRRLRDLPMHVFFASHAKVVDEPRVGKITVPALSGQMSNDMVQLVSVSAYLALAASDEEEEDERVLLLKNYPKFRVKARSPWGVTIPSEIEDPDITKLLDALGFE